MTSKASIIDRAAELLAASPTGDISTRAVCEAAGITQPVLYRMFGDKDGLLSAVVDRVWDQYLSMKREAERSDDPLDDLRAGWDSHVAFALAHPHAYRLLFGTALATTPEAGAEAMRLLRVNLERLASIGRLAIAPDVAARIVMAANTGVALALLLRPSDYPDMAISTTVRNTVYRSILVPTDTTKPDVAEACSVAATTLRADLTSTQADGLFSAAESRLLDEWLQRIQARPRAQARRQSKGSLE